MKWRIEIRRGGGWQVRNPQGNLMQYMHDKTPMRYGSIDAACREIKSLMQWYL